MSHEASDDPADEPSLLRKQLVAELARLISRLERRRGRDLDRSRLAARLNVSQSSLYAYLNGTTLPRPLVFDELLHALQATKPELRSLSTLRDKLETARKASRTSKGTALSGQIPVPRQLPPAIRDFIGRNAELRRLDELIAEPSLHSPTIVTVEGPPGVGKTTLGVRWAHQIKSRYPDGQLHVNLRGFGTEPPTDPDQALYGFLQALGAPPVAIPGTLPDKTALYRTLTADRRLLVVLDNARTAAQIRPLIPGSPQCLVIVTTRSRFESTEVRENSYVLSLDVFSHAEAMWMLENRLGPERLRGTTAHEIVELCDRLPLALGIAAARMSRSRRSLESFAERLQQERLETLGSNEPDLDLRTVFHTSYALLPPRSARLFRLLGVHDGADIDDYACAALSGVSLTEAARHMDILRDAHLVLENDGTRWSTHDLLRVFARHLADESDERERLAALGRVLDYYLGCAVSASRCIRPYRMDELPAVEQRYPMPFLDGLSTAMDWFSKELPVLHTMIAKAEKYRFDRQAWQLAWACTVYLRRTNRHAERVRMHRIGLAAAHRAKDASVYAASARFLAEGLARLGELREAEALLQRSLAQCVEIGDQRGVIQAHLSMVRVREAHGRFQEALEHARSALALAPGVPDPLARADGLNAVARMSLRLGRNADALSHGREALAVYERTGFPEGEADVLWTIGRAQQNAGRHEEAVRHLLRALWLERTLHDRFWEAHVLADLAEAYAATGEHDLSRASFQDALAIFENLGHPLADTVRSRLSMSERRCQPP